MAKLVAPVVLLVICSALFADMAAVTVKLADAKVAVAAGKDKEASDAFTAAAAIVKKDSAGAGDYAESFARHVSEALARAAEGAGKGKLEPEAFDILSYRAGNLYEAVIPAGKGDLAAVAAHLRKLVKTAPKSSARDLEAAAKAVSEAGEAGKKSALTLAFVTVGALVPIDRAAELIVEKKAQATSAWLDIVMGYLNHESRVSDDKLVQEITYRIADMRQLMSDLQTGTAAFDADQLPDIREEILTMMTSSVAPAPSGAKK